MTEAIADHWGKGDVYGLIVSALHKMSKPARNTSPVTGW
jgi:hypothetical protein